MVRSLGPEDDHGLFPTAEVWPPESTNQMLIYPTPAKQNSSFRLALYDPFRANFNPGRASRMSSSRSAFVALCSATST